MFWGLYYFVYTVELSYLLQEHGVSFNLFADDTQFYLSFNNIANIENSQSTILFDIKKWMHNKQLKLYENNTDCIIVDNIGIVRRLNGLNNININSNNVPFSNKVKDLGVIIAKDLIFNDHINEIVKVVLLRPVTM